MIDSDWEDLFQTPKHLVEDGSSESNSETPMDIDDINQPRSCKRQSLQATATIGTTAHAKKKLVKILKGDLCIPRQRWGLDRLLATLVIPRKDPKLRTAYRKFRTFAY